MIEKLLDEYELKARVAPGVILILPVLVDAAYAVPALSNWPIFAAGGICCLALLYGLGHVVRARGKAIENDLWISWDGPPSTRFMRDRDRFFDASLKTSIKAAVSHRFSVSLLSKAEESSDPGRADRVIADAFRRVREFLRKHDSGGLWNKNNADYGFCRNLLGCRFIWTMLAAAATVFAIVVGIERKAGAFNVASAIGFASFDCAVYVGWMVLPDATRRTAERYAELAWIAFAETE